MNTFYNNIWDWNYIQQLEAQRYHQEQTQQVIDCANKLREFLDGADKIDLPYQNAALLAFCTVLQEYSKKNNIHK